MSNIEIRQEALEGQLSQVIATTAANTEVLQELKSVFTKYLKELKDTSALAQPVKPTTTTEVACSQEAADDDTDTLDFGSEDATLAEDSKHRAPLSKSSECGLPTAAVSSPVQPLKAELTAPEGKDVVSKKPALPPAKLKNSALKDMQAESPNTERPRNPPGVTKPKKSIDAATVATVNDAEQKDAEGKKGSQEPRNGSVE